MNKNDIKNLVQDLIEKMKLDISEINLSGDEGKTTLLEVNMPEAHFFTHREGEALHALNHIVRRITENKNKDQAGVDVIIDIGGFQKKKIDAVKAVAHMMAERARYFKSNIEVDPMGAFERRIVHEFLSESEDLKTESVGEGRTRRVVIKYTGNI